jgi:hypothetical protein
MAYLLDTGILLRLANPADHLHGQVRIAIGTLGNRGERLPTATQNIAEFCNVASRPVANNGLGHPPAAVLEFIEKDVEPICAVVAEIDSVYPQLKRLIATYNVVGKQVNEALREATEDLKAGRFRPAADVSRDMRRQFNLPE